MFSNDDSILTNLQSHTNIMFHLYSCWLNMLPNNAFVTAWSLHLSPKKIDDCVYNMNYTSLGFKIIKKNFILTTECLYGKCVTCYMINKQMSFKGWIVPLIIMDSVCWYFRCWDDWLSINQVFSIPWITTLSNQIYAHTYMVKTFYHRDESTWILHRRF